MKKVVILIATVMFMFSCRNNRTTNDCIGNIDYTDTLQINLENTTLKVALIDLSQENDIRAYTIFFNNHLLVLGTHNSFYAFHVDCLERDTLYEQKLNTQTFKRAFTAFGNLYGIDSSNHAFQYEQTTAEWLQTTDLPLSNSIPIFENDTYLCYTIRYGEFGGYVFFYNKNTKKITFVPAHAVSMMEQTLGGFHIVSCLSHMGYYSWIKEITNPDVLFKMPDTFDYSNHEKNRQLYYNIMWADTTVTDNTIRDVSVITMDKNGKVISHNEPEYIYETDEKLLTAAFKIKNQNYFTTDEYVRIDGSYRSKTNLAKLQDTSLIMIPTVDTIFADLPRSSGEITRKMQDKTIIDFVYRNRDEDEYSKLLSTSFIITDTTLIRINWHNRVKSQSED